MKTGKFRAVCNLLFCLALIFGLLGGLFGSRVVLAAQENNYGSSSPPPSEEQVLPDEPPEEEIEIFCTWPILEGEPGDSFKYEITFNYKISERRMFDLNLTVPLGWTGSPLSSYPEREIEAFEPDPGKATDKLSVAVRPQQGIRTEPGEYVFTFEVASGELQDSVELKAVVVARPPNYALDTFTPTGQNDVRVKAGEDNHTTIYLRNVATGDLSNIILSSEHPEGWSVVFTPSGAKSLESGLFTEVDVVIAPPAGTEAGDYPVIVKATSEETESSLELRATVLTSTAWGGVGIGVGVAVITGLIIWFRRLGRR